MIAQHLLKKIMIFLECCISVCYVNKCEMWGCLCLKSIDNAGIIFEEGQSIIPCVFVNIQHILTLQEAPFALGAEEWDTEWFIALWDAGEVPILAKSGLISWWLVPSHRFSASLRAIAVCWGGLDSTSEQLLTLSSVLSLLWFDLFSALFPSLCTSDLGFARLSVSCLSEWEGGLQSLVWYWELMGFSC